MTSNTGNLISTNPARNYEIIGEVPISTKKEIISKVKKAKKAKLLWKETSLEGRIEYFETGPANLKK